MKKFKNNINIKGYSQHIRAFIDDLRHLGYVDSDNQENKIYTINSVDCLFVYASGKFSRGVVDFSYPVYNLPDQWKEALSKASEVEQEEFKDGDWIVFEDFGSLYPGTSFSLNVPYLLCDNRLNFKMDDMGHHNGWSSFTVETAIKEKGIKIRKAIPEEIKSRLLKLAKDKGFMDGSMGVAVRDTKEGEMYRINPNRNVSISYRKEDMNIGEEWYYNENTDTLITWGRGVFVVYEKGVWATFKSSYPSITINGYKAEFKEFGISFNNGCAQIDKKLFIALNTLIIRGEFSGNKSITSVKIGAGEFTAEQIRLISEYYSK